MRRKKKYSTEIVNAWISASLEAGGKSQDIEPEILREKYNSVFQDLQKNNIGELYDPDEYIEIYKVPSAVFKLAVDDLDLNQLNDKVKGLSLEYQKLLHYLARDYDPKNICDSMAYEDLATLVTRRNDCLMEFRGSNDSLDDKLIGDLLEVYNFYQKIRDNFLKITDELVSERDKKNNQRKWSYSAVGVIISISIILIMVYPRLVRKDYEILFLYGAEKTGLDINMDSAEYLDEMILDEAQNSPESYWLLSLRALQEGDTESCRTYLESLKAADPELFNDRGRYIYNRLRK